MSAALVAKCAGCSADVSFSNGALVVVCDYCKSVVARGDRDLENLGKVVDLVDTGSPLQIGLRGSWRGAPFELHGRAQLGHAAGGLWDEWYAAFDDGRWGWLAEAQGKLYLTFAVDLGPGTSALGSFEDVEVGEPVVGFPGATPMIAAEKGRGRYVSARGNIPYRLVPNAEFPFVDASGEGGAFATIDYGELPPTVYAGREVTLAELGFAHLAAAERDATRVKGDRLACPECDGTLELRAPDRAMRLACPYCGVLLDVSQGRLSKLQMLGKPRTLALPLGTKGTIEKVTYTVIGYVERYVQFSGVKYRWDEYLLHERATGFRWLVCSDEQWSFVTPVAAGDVGDNGANTVRWSGHTFKLFQDTAATVDYVLGEFYWKIAPGERVQAADYIAPPLMLSRESSDDEINWSVSHYKTVAEVEQAFGVSDLPRGSKVAPNQPYPHGAIFRWWGIFIAASLALVVGLSCTQPGKLVSSAHFLLDAPTADGTQVLFSEPFALVARKNVAISITADVDNSWAYVEGNLVEEQTGFVQSFAVPIEYYHGVELGESYSEGGPRRTVIVSAPPAGQYVLRLEAQWDRAPEQALVMGRSPKRVPSQLTVTVKQGVPRPWRTLWLLGLLSVIPASVLFHRRSFERARWADSDHSPYSSDE